MLTKMSLRENIVLGMSAMFLVIPIMMMLDRDPPYERLSGVITPEMPQPGDFVAVEWKIKVVRNCAPNVRRNVTRRIIDASGKIHDFEPIEGVFGTGPPQAGISRSFQLPVFIVPGPAVYKSTASFECNIMQKFLSWPVHVDKPDIKFTIRPKN